VTAPLASIIVRSFNEGWALKETLSALRTQDYKNWELIVIDSGSTDGSEELICQARPNHFIRIRPQDYQPGRVLNHGMRIARGEFGIFLNADATPRDSGWLGPLVEALQDPRVAAVFGRQVPRPDCQAVFAHDYERCFGERRESMAWDHFFSMASSGIRRDVWARRGFLENLQYSEDEEYTRWCRAEGYRIAYCPASAAVHSHNYNPRQAYKRSFGEAWALAAMRPDRAVRAAPGGRIVVGWLNDVRRDLGFCLRTGKIKEWPRGLRIRWVQRLGKEDGFRVGRAMHQPEPAA
jgi:rhamnosyltransferase